jgi:hypothetical protein
MQEATEICVTGPQWLGANYGKELHPERIKFGNETPVGAMGPTRGIWKDPMPPDAISRSFSEKITHSHDACP